MGSICRLCLHKNELDSMKNIFEFSPKYFELNLTEILYWIFDVEIIVEDTYSKLICYKCLNVIECIGRYRQFFQVNQTFLHERRCPADYEVKSGWYNTRDIGTNTDFKEDPKYVKISIKDLNALSKPQVILGKLDKADILSEENMKKSPLKLNENMTQNIEVNNGTKLDWVNVSINTLKEFINARTPTETLDRIDVPSYLFDYYSPQITLPDIEKECLTLGYAKMEKSFYKLNDIDPYIDLKRIDSGKALFRHYKKIGKYTYKKIPRLRKFEQIQEEKKKKLIEDYYYSMPTSALRELITETNPQKNKQISITSLVKTNEIDVHVCKYCSRVFNHRKNLYEHCVKVHQMLMKNKCKTSFKNFVLPKKIVSSTVRTIAKKQTNKLARNSRNSLGTSNYFNNSNERDTDNNEDNLINISSSSFFIDTIKNKLDSIIDNKKYREQNSISDPTCLNCDMDLSNTVDEEPKINSKNEEQFVNVVEIVKNPLDIPSDNTGMESESGLNSNLKGSPNWIRVKDLKKLQIQEQSVNTENPNNDFHIEYLKTVIFGNCSEANPKITYHYDSSCNLKDHTYANNVENVIGDDKLRMLPDRKRSKKKIASDVADEIKKKFADIKKTRETLEKMKKIRFALYNEIEHCSIKSTIAALREKLEITNMA